MGQDILLTMPSVLGCPNRRVDTTATEVIICFYSALASPHLKDLTRKVFTNLIESSRRWAGAGSPDLWVCSA